MYTWFANWNAWFIVKIKFPKHHTCDNQVSERGIKTIRLVIVYLFFFQCWCSRGTVPWQTRDILNIRAKDLCVHCCIEMQKRKCTIAFLFIVGEWNKVSRQGFFSIAEHLLMECVDDCHLVHLFSCYIMFNMHNFSHEKTSSLMAQQIQSTLFTVKVIWLTTGSFK